MQNVNEFLVEERIRTTVQFSYYLFEKSIKSIKQQNGLFKSMIRIFGEEDEVSK